MISPENQERRHIPQNLSSVQIESAKEIASLIFLGLEESSDKEGFTERELDDAKKNILKLHKIDQNR